MTPQIDPAQIAALMQQLQAIAAAQSAPVVAAPPPPVPTLAQVSDAATRNAIAAVVALLDNLHARAVDTDRRVTGESAQTDARAEYARVRAALEGAVAGE